MLLKVVVLLVCAGARVSASNEDDAMPGLLSSNPATLIDTMTTIDSSALAAAPGWPLFSSTAACAAWAAYMYGCDDPSAELQTSTAASADAIPDALFSHGASVAWISPTSG